MMAAMAQTWDEVNADPGIRVAILPVRWGVLRRRRSPGHDPVASRDASSGPRALRLTSGVIKPLLKGFLLDKPLIAAGRGRGRGRRHRDPQGTTSASPARAPLRRSEVRWGLYPRRVGGAPAPPDPLRRAADMLLTGRHVGLPRPRSWSLGEVVPDGRRSTGREVAAAVAATAHRGAGVLRRCGPRLPAGDRGHAHRLEIAWRSSRATTPRRARCLHGEAHPRLPGTVTLARPGRRNLCPLGVSATPPSRSSATGTEFREGRHAPTAPILAASPLLSGRRRGGVGPGRTFCWIDGAVRPMVTPYGVAFPRRRSSRTAGDLSGEPSPRPCSRTVRCRGPPSATPRRPGARTAPRCQSLCTTRHRRPS